ncbi:MFS general substrate transporter [Ceraceosorus guamensis]|uniref:MFS general substrate transporter n=1 Tax=Ceraceosorus guamensis TaxID=1522189 RepID=A0A316VUQ9_9BASI|nr:MFS general substrate transporter [Ceraceosorus guamensis]PWN41356.1 MFS general substrate transporter [Ceraceosorus guamensis]
MDGLDQPWQHGRRISDKKAEDLAQSGLSRGMLAEHDKEDAWPTSDQSREAATATSSAARLPCASDSADGFPEGGASAWLVVLASFILYFGEPASHRRLELPPNFPLLVCLFGCSQDVDPSASVGFGFQNAFGVFQTYYTNERPGGPLSTPSRISWVGSFQVFATFASGTVTGILIDRLDARLIVASGCLVFVTSCMLISISLPHYWAVFLSQGLLQGIGIGILFAPALACTSHFFARRRGVALGIVASGSSLGGVVWPIVLDQLIHHGPGFEWALRISGFIALALLLAVLPLVKKRVPPVQGKFFALGAFKHVGFTMLLAGQFLVYLGLFWPYYYLPSLAASQGVASTAIFYLASASNGASILGRLTAGLLGDKLGRYNILIISLSLSGLIIFSTIAALPLRGQEAKRTIFAIATVYGFFSGAFFALQAAAVTSLAPSANRVGEWIAMLYLAVSLPALFGPPIGAQLFQTRGYTAALAFAGCMVSAGAIVVTFSRLALDRRLLKRL